MKKVFMPSMDELYLMQDMGGNVYKYLLVKAIESMICYGVNYPKAEMFKTAYKYLQENIEIVRAICSLYPEEMDRNEVVKNIAKNDVELCLRLINSGETKGCSLDNLARFDKGTLFNSLVIKDTVTRLDSELQSNPKYRFEYEENALLDKIFNREIGESELMTIFGKNKNEVISSLVRIEPTYLFNICGNNGYRPEELNLRVNDYANRYGITNSIGCEYLGKDILTKPDTNVKRLFRCIKDRNK